MAKFNTYSMQANTDDSRLIVQKHFTAISLESAWHKAIAEAFEAIEPGTGDVPAEIYVSRVASASEYHG